VQDKAEAPLTSIYFEFVCCTINYTTLPLSKACNNNYYDKSISSDKILSCSLQYDLSYNSATNPSSGTWTW